MLNKAKHIIRLDYNMCFREYKYPPDTLVFQTIKTAEREILKPVGRFVCLKSFIYRSFINLESQILLFLPSSQGF